MEAAAVIELVDVSDGRIDQVLALAQQWSERDTINRSDFARIIEEVDLPARLYSSAVEGIQALGLRLVDDPEVENDPEEATSAVGSSADPYDRFLRHRILTQPEEIALGKRVERGRLAQEALATEGLDSKVRSDLERQARDGRLAADEFVAHNHRLVMNMVYKYRSQFGVSLSLDDLFQEAYVGLAHAVDLFDWRMGNKFSTYATWWIRQAIQRALANKGRTIRLPADWVAQLRQTRVAADELMRSGIEATDVAVATSTGLTVERVRELRAVGGTVASLDQPIGDGAVTLGTLTAGADDDGPEAVAMKLAFDEVLDNVLERLTERERDVIERRFGLRGYDPHSYAAIAEVHGVTGEACRRMVLRILSKLNCPQVRDALADFADFLPRELPTSHSDESQTAPNYR